MDSNQVNKDKISTQNQEMQGTLKQKAVIQFTQEREALLPTPRGKRKEQAGHYETRARAM